MEDALEEDSVALPVSPFELVHAQAAQACTGGLTSPKFHS